MEELNGLLRLTVARRYVDDSDVRCQSTDEEEKWCQPGHILPFLSEFCENGAETEQKIMPADSSKNLTTEEKELKGIHQGHMKLLIATKESVHMIGKRLLEHGLPHKVRVSIQDKRKSGNIDTVGKGDESSAQTNKKHRILL